MLVCIYVCHISSAPFLNLAHYPLTVDLSAVTCRLCFSRVREAAGLDRCHVQVVGAAPIAKNILEFFLDFDIPIYEIYGMSESSRPQTVYCDGELGAPKMDTHAYTCDNTRVAFHITEWNGCFHVQTIEQKSKRSVPHHTHITPMHTSHTYHTTHITPTYLMHPLPLRPRASWLLWKADARSRNED